MGKKDEEEEKADLTALEDIGHYLHQLNPEVDKKLEFGKKETGITEEPTEGQLEETPEEQPALEEPLQTELPTEQFAPEPTPEPAAEEFKTEEPIEEPAPEETQPMEAAPSEAPQIEEPQVSEETPPSEESPVTEGPTPEEAAPTEEVTDVPEKETPQPERTKVEKFEEVKEFGKNISTTTAAVPGNPPFSIVIKEIKFNEDADDILAALKEYGIATASNESIFKQGLSTGSILITQLAESTAILLVHKFRQYDLEIEMGLSEEIRPYKTREKVGLVSRKNLGQNKSENVDLHVAIESSNEIPISTTPTLENFIINRYIGIVSEHSIMNDSEIDKTPWEEKYAFLANQLKSKALKLRGNAIVGITFQLTPLDPPQYKLSCTGNVVWVSPIEGKID